jgi:hypothetical protein
MALQKQHMATQLSSRQLLHASIESYENATPLHRVAEQQSIGPLLMSPQPGGQRLQASRRLAIQGPEFMPRVLLFPPIDDA